MNTKLHIISFFFNYLPSKRLSAIVLKSIYFILEMLSLKPCPLHFWQRARALLWRVWFQQSVWLHVPTFRASSPLNSGSLSVNILKPIYKGHYQDSGALDPTCVLDASCVWHWDYGGVKSYLSGTPSRMQIGLRRGRCVCTCGCICVCICVYVCDDMRTIQHKLYVFSAQSTQSWATPVATDSHIEMPSL